MANVYDTADQLAKDLEASEQFQDLKKAYDMLKLDAVAYAMFQQFQDKQVELQQKQATGQEITQEEMAGLQTIGEKMQNMQPINDLLAREQALSTVMDDLNRVIAQPIVALYQANMKKPDAQ
ncbi:YlbF family regulator [Lacticaseibacillus yichunensis]|uniref:UPF0342 protein ACFQ47_04540 n=1 Tax=Lacticaseibacillus yichunensis TaxID=2486015 RepID=A0ABW4CLZ5_9LACO|nr:YlbF family regulator [Lacticaseibacillus yichunensis]